MARNKKRVHDHKCAVSMYWPRTGHCSGCDSITDRGCTSPNSSAGNDWYWCMLILSARGLQIGATKDRKFKLWMFMPGFFLWGNFKCVLMLFRVFGQRKKNPEANEKHTNLCICTQSHQVPHWCPLMTVILNSLSGGRMGKKICHTNFLSSLTVCI